MSISDPLFPVHNSRIVLGFTTRPLINIPSVNRVALADDALGVHKVSSATAHAIVRPPVPPADGSGELAWEALFRAGSINPGNKLAPHGGFSFYAHGPAEFSQKLRSEKPKEVIMSYKVMFENGFQWAKGGKLPGICEQY